MKQRILILVACLLVFATIQLQAGSHNDQWTKELKEITNVMQANQLSVDHWSIQLRENIDQDQLASYILSINQVFSETDMTITSSNQAKKYQWIPHKKDGIAESIIIVVSKNTSDAELIYTLTAETQRTIKQVIAASKIDIGLSKIFSDKIKKYTCASIEIDGMIDSVYFFERIQETLRVREIHRLNEPDFIVLSGYVQQWETFIPSAGDQMNIQMAARYGAEGKTTFTIGTPILTTEY